MRWTPADGAVSVFEEKAPGKEGKKGGSGGGARSAKKLSCPPPLSFPSRSRSSSSRIENKTFEIKLRTLSGYAGGKFLERNPVHRPPCACDKRGGGGGFSSVAPGISACGACGGSRGGSEERSGGAAGSSPPPPSCYSEPDFYVGAPLRLHGRGFVLLAAGEPALRRMEVAGHPLARRDEAVAAARAALGSAAAEASAAAAAAGSTSPSVAFGGSELLREALADVVLQKREREEEKEKGAAADSPSSRRRGATEAPSPPSPHLLLLLTPEELGEAFAAAGAPLGGPAQVKVTLARALGGSERPGNRVDVAEVVERLFG